MLRVWVYGLYVCVSALVVSQFPGCASGTFGEDCKNYCHCMNNEPCDPVSGRCHGGCSDGWSGPTCDTCTPIIMHPTLEKVNGHIACGFSVWLRVCVSFTLSSNFRMLHATVLKFHIHIRHEKKS